MMKYHDIDDKRGKVGIRKEYRDALPGMLKLYDIFKDADVYKISKESLNRHRMACRLMTSCDKDNPFSEIFSKFACISASTTPKECAGKRRIKEGVKAGKISLYGAYKPKRYGSGAGHTFQR